MQSTTTAPAAARTATIDALDATAAKGGWVRQSAICGVVTYARGHYLAMCVVDMQGKIVKRTIVRGGKPRAIRSAAVFNDYLNGTVALVF